MTYTVYEKNSGKIIKVVNCHPSIINNQLAEGQAYILGRFSDAEFYIIEGIEFPRPEMPCAIDKTIISADGEDTATISNIPEGAQAFIDEAFFEVITDGTLTIVSDLVGKIDVKLILEPYLNWEVQIDGI